MTPEYFIQTIINPQSKTIFHPDIESTVMEKFISHDLLPEYEYHAYQEGITLLSLISLNYFANFFNQLNKAYSGGVYWLIEQTSETIDNLSSQILVNRLHLFKHYKMTDLLCPDGKFWPLDAILLDKFDFINLNHPTYPIEQLKSFFSSQYTIGSFILPLIEKQQLEENVLKAKTNSKVAIKL